MRSLTWWSFYLLSREKCPKMCLKINLVRKNAVTLRPTMGVAHSGSLAPEKGHELVTVTL